MHRVHTGPSVAMTLHLAPSHLAGCVVIWLSMHNREYDVKTELITDKIIFKIIIKDVLHADKSLDVEDLISMDLNSS